MRYARWHESMETGDREVDEQHRALYDLVNDLNASVLLDEGHQGESDALQRIVTYAATHFASEEALMERFSYPKTEEHKIAHSEFAQTAQRLVGEHTAGRGPGIRELAAFMEEWLAEHIANFDQPMVEYVRAARLGASGV